MTWGRSHDLPTPQLAGHNRSTGPQGGRKEARFPGASREVLLWAAAFRTRGREAGRMRIWRLLEIPLKLLPFPETEADSLLPTRFSSRQQLHCQRLERGKIPRRCQAPVPAAERGRGPHALASHQHRLFIPTLPCEAALSLSPPDGGDIQGSENVLEDPPWTRRPTPPAVPRG